MNFRQVGGGISDATSFSDNLQPPDQPFIWGDSYYCCAYSTGGVTGNADQLAGKVNRSGAGLTFTGGGGGSIVFKCCAIPRVLSFLQVDGKAQFAQVTIVSDGSAGVNCNAVGVGVFAQTNKSLIYGLTKNPQGTTAGVGIIKTVVGADTLLGSVHAVNAGDVVRLEVRPGSTTNQLIAKINGVIVETQTDNGITAGGMPCLNIPALFTGGQTTVFSNFSCGLLTS